LREHLWRAHGLVTKMPPPQIPILAQSENKSKFLERLGISDQTEDGKKLYAMMKV